MAKMDEHGRNDEEWQKVVKAAVEANLSKKSEKWQKVAKRQKLAKVAKRREWVPALRSAVSTCA